MLMWALFVPQSDIQNVIEEHTDLPIMSFYHANNGLKLYYLWYVKRGLTPNPVYDIINIKSQLGRKNCNMGNP